MFVIVSWLIHCSKCLSWNFTLFFLFIQNSINFWMLFLEDCFGFAGTGKIGIVKCDISKRKSAEKTRLAERWCNAQKSRFETRLLPQRIQFHKKFTMFFLKETTCFKAMPQCHFVSLFFFAFFIPFRSNQLLREAFCACVWQWNLFIVLIWCSVSVLTTVQPVSPQVLGLLGPPELKSQMHTDYDKTMIKVEITMLIFVHWNCFNVSTVDMLRLLVRTCLALHGCRRVTSGASAHGLLCSKIQQFFYKTLNKA